MCFCAQRVILYFCPHKCMPETGYMYNCKYVNHKLAKPLHHKQQFLSQSSNRNMSGICFYVLWWDLRHAQTCIPLVCLSSVSYESLQSICSGANAVTLSIWTSSEFSVLLLLVFTIFTRTRIVARAQRQAASLNKMEMGHFIWFSFPPDFKCGMMELIMAVSILGYSQVWWKNGGVEWAQQVEQLCADLRGEGTALSALDF